MRNNLKELSHLRFVRSFSSSRKLGLEGPIPFADLVELPGRRVHEFAFDLELFAVGFRDGSVEEGTQRVEEALEGVHNYNKN